jgi:D-arabinose 5-phosphate isomerase GutQ
MFDASLEHAASNLQVTRGAIDIAVAEALVDAIFDARPVFVLGYGSSAFLAGLLEHGLTPYCANVQSLALAGGPSDAARRLFNASRGDLLIAIAFPRYVDDTIELARLAASHSVRVVALTDTAASPLAQVADLVLSIRTERRLAANCDTAVLAVIEALCDAVAHLAERSFEAASGLTEFVLPWLVQPPLPLALALFLRKCAAHRLLGRARIPGLRLPRRASVSQGACVAMQVWLRPSRLAEYSALSAAATRPLASPLSPGRCAATPRLTVTMPAALTGCGIRKRSTS